jgi:hypothetical protein
VDPKFSVAIEEETQVKEERISRTIEKMPKPTDEV